MVSWFRSDVGHPRLEGLVKRGLLCARTAAREWVVPSCKEVLALLDGYTISFVPFHEKAGA
jgi:hypothetical protein